MRYGYSMDVFERRGEGREIFVAQWGKEIKIKIKMKMKIKMKIKMKSCSSYHQDIYIHILIHILIQTSEINSFWGRDSLGSW